MSGAVDFSAAAGWYDRNAEAYRAASDSCDPRLERDLLLEGLAPGSLILDVGCGAGRDLAAFQAAGHAVTGLDPSAEMRRICRARLGEGVALRADRIEAFADPSGSWDAIWAMASLLHVPAMCHAEVIARLHGALAPGGRLYLCLKAPEEGAELDVVDAEGRPMARMPLATAEEIAQAVAPEAWRVWPTIARASSGLETVWTNILLRRA
jgi:SAM-dependent methyltransferase